jgi:ligand-binding sensor domain-containing protein
MKKSVYFILLILIASVLTISCKPDSNAASKTNNSGKSQSSSAECQKSWTSFTAGNAILDLLVDGNDLWAATSGGVIRWKIDSGTYRKYTTQDGLGSNNVRKIVQDSRGNIWTTAQIAGVNRFNGTEWKSFAVNDGLISQDVITLAADKQGGVWVSGYWGVSYFDGAVWQSYSTVPPDAIIVGGGEKETPPRLINLTLGEGSLDAVDTILVDSKGNVWFSTRGRGVVRFDGQNWRLFSTEDGLANGGVNAIYEDKDGNLWFGGNGNVTRFDGSVFKNFSIAEYQSVIPRPFIEDILQDNQGNIWVAAYQGGISRFDGANWRVFKTADGLPSDNAQAIFLADDGNPGVITDKGVCRFDGDRWQILTTRDGLPEGKVRVAYRDDQGNLWFGSTKGGITRLNDAVSSRYMTGDGLSDTVVTAIIQDKQNILWFAGRDGSLNRYDGTNWRSFGEKDGLAAGYVLPDSLVIDRKGQLWVVSTGEKGGVSLYDGTRWRTITTEDGLAENLVTSIFQDSQGKLWFGTGSSGVSCFDGVNWRTFTTGDGLVSNQVGMITEDKKGNIWLSSNGTCSRYDSHEWKIFNSGEGFNGKMAADKQGNMWFAAQSGISRFDGKTWQSFTQTELDRPWDGAFFADNQGNIWISRFDEHGGALFRFDGANWQKFTPGNGLAGYQIREVKQDSQGNIWALSEAGVSRYDGVKWRTFTTQDGLAGKDVGCMFEDNQGNFWFGTGGGLSCFRSTPK